MDKRRKKELIDEGRRLVEEGRSLLKSTARMRIRLGQIALEWEADGGTVTEYASAIGLEDSAWLNDWKSVVSKWGGNPILTSWSILKELSILPDPRAAYAAIERDHGKVDILTVRTHLGKKSAGVRITSPVADKVREAEKWLSDPEVVRGLSPTTAATVAKAVITRPEVARSVAEDWTTRSAVSSAALDVDSERRTAHSEWVKKSIPALHTATSIYNVEARLESATLNVREALRLLKEEEPIVTDADREAIRSKLHKLDTALDWLRSHVEAGKPFDEALEAILRGE